MHVEPDAATVVLESGETRAFDLVIGADGLASAVRRSLPDDPGIRYAGYTAWRGVTADPFEVPAAGETWGLGERFGIVPMAGGRVYWFATANLPAAQAFADEREELLRRFAGWHDPIPALLAATDRDAVLRNDVVDLAPPLPRLARGRIVLVGDAAHAMTPNLGQGGNLALEDAVTLTRLIARRDHLASALAEYDTVRRARVAPIARRSWQLGRIAQAHGQVAVALRDTLMRLTPANAAGRAAARIQAWSPPTANAEKISVLAGHRESRTSIV